VHKHTQLERERAPFGLAGVACLVTIAVIHYATEPLLSQYFASSVRLLIYLAAPLAVASVILYRSSWHRDLPRLRRVFSVILSSCLVLGVALLFVGLAEFMILFFVSGPPSSRK
jgi:hypothetical protein